MQKKFIVNLVFLLLLNLLVKPFYILGIDAEILNRVGPESYGNYFAIINFTFLLNIFLDLGITNFNTKNIAQNQQLMGKHLSKVLSLKLLLSLFYILITLGLGFWWGFRSEELHILSFLALNQSIVAVILYLRSNLSGLHMFKQDSLISILDRLLLIIICSALLWGGVTDQAFQIEWFVYAQTFSYLVTAIVTFLLLRTKAEKLKFSFSKVFSLMILKQSYPYALLVLLMSFYFRSDSVMLEKMLDDGAEQAGYYAQGYRFFEAANMIGYLFAALLLPLFSNMLKKKESVDELVMLAFKLIFSGSLILCLACVFFNEDIISWKYADIHPYSAVTFSVLMMCFVCVTSTYIFGTLLTANGNLKALNIMALAAVFVNVGLNLLLIPKYLALGSAVASLITQLFVTIAQIVLCKHYLNLKLPFIQLFQIVGFSAVLYTMGYFGQSYFEAWGLNLVFFVTIGLLWAMGTKMISIPGLYRIIKYDR